MMQHRQHRQTLKPTAYLVSPPPPWWRPAGGKEGNMRAARAAGAIVDYSKLLGGWITFCDALTEEGSTVIVVPHSPCREIFDPTFIRDTCFFVPKQRGYVMSKMHAPHRMGEPDYIRRFLRDSLMVPVHGSMRYTCEGDSCLFMLPNCTGVIFGHGSRASIAAAAELQELFGLPVTALPLREEFFHLDVAAGALAGATPAVVACREAFATGLAWMQLSKVCERDGSILEEVSLADARAYATNFINVGGTIFLPPQTSAHYQARLGSLGYRVRVVDIGDLLALGGGSAACASNHASEALSQIDASVLAKYNWPAVRDQYLEMASHRIH